MHGYEVDVVLASVARVSLRLVCWMSSEGAMSERYQTYLASREWALLREAVRERSGNTCERCKAAPQQAVHHLTYARLYSERLDDLMAICDPCHAYLSGVSDFDPAASPADGAPTRALDRRLIISIRREVRCYSCRFDTDGDYFLCSICKEATCPSCLFMVGDQIRCVNHAEAP